MREIRTSGLMSGEGKRIAQTTPRLSSTLPAREPCGRLGWLIACEWLSMSEIGE